MSDHQVMESEGARPSNWLWALVAAVVAAVAARWLGDVGVSAAVLFGAVVFLVYAVVLAQFWEEPANGDHDHGHVGHGHTDHGHEAPVHDPAPMASHAPSVPASMGAPASASATPAPEVEVAAIPMTASGEPAKPQGLTGPRGGKPDDLQEIEGIGPALEKLCHELGIYHFDQIAGWGVGETAWMDGNLKGFKGRVSRDKWVAQARLIVAEGVDAFRIRAKTNDY